METAEVKSEELGVMSYGKLFFEKRFIGKGIQVKNREFFEKKQTATPHSSFLIPHSSQREES